MGANRIALVNAAVRLLVCSSTASSPRLPVAARDRQTRSPRFRRDPSVRDVALDPGRATVPRISGTAHVAFGGSDSLGPCDFKDFVAHSHTPNDHCVRFAVVVTFHDATPGRALPLSRTGLSPAGPRQLCLAHRYSFTVTDSARAPCRSPGAHWVRLAKVITWLCSSLSDELCPLLRIKSARLLIKPLPGEP